MITHTAVIKYLKDLLFRKKSKDDRELTKQALDDYRDSLPLPECPKCGGKLVYMDKSMGSGIRCFGTLQLDKEEGYHELKNGCGYHGLTLMYGNKLIIIGNIWHK